MRTIATPTLLHTLPPFNIPNVVFVACHFDSSRFTDADFEHYNIPFPLRLSSAVARRRAEFLAGRHCALIALRQLIGRTPEVRTCDDRSPAFPLGVIGSISHSANIAGCSVAKHTDYGAIGMDLEEVLSNSDSQQLAAQFSDASERYILSHRMSEERAATLLFSAKEAVYKAFSATTRRRLGFHDLRAVGATESLLTLRSAIPLGGAPEIGRYLHVLYAFYANHVVTLHVSAATSRNKSV